MRRHLFSQLVLPLTLALVIGLTFQHTRAQSTPSAIDRTLEPVIVPGSQLASFVGAPVGQIFVYAFKSGAWAQIRYQVDEKNAADEYVTSEDTTLDANDEIVFMAKDAGDAAGNRPPNNGQGVGASWYQVAVANPVNAAASGYVYVVRSATLSQTFTGDYVSFTAATHRISGETYTVGFAASDEPPKTERYLDYVSLNGGVDLLDRAPKFRTACLGNLCAVNEDSFPPLDDNVVKDGPVRLIMRDGQILAYGSMILWRVVAEIGERNNIRLSSDFSEQAAGSTLYTAVTPDAGLTVDGQPETMPETPASTWWQLSAPSGTLIQVARIASLGGTAVNTYRDSSAVDNLDTGDKKHFGEIGLSVNNPNSTVDFQFALYMLTGRQPNVGSTYDSYFNQPLTIRTSVRPLATDNSLFLPLVTRSAE